MSVEAAGSGFVVGGVSSLTVCLVGFSVFISVEFFRSAVIATFSRAFELLVIGSCLLSRSGLVDASVNLGLVLGGVVKEALLRESSIVFSFSIELVRSAFAIVSDLGSILTCGSGFTSGSDKELETSGGVRTAETKELAEAKPGSL